MRPDTINGVNLYAYCRNNPIKYCDPSRYSPIVPIVILVISAIAGAIIGGVLGNKQSKEENESGEEIDESQSTVKGAILGFGAGLAIGGAFLSVAAVFAGAFTAVTGTVVKVFGWAAKQLFALGALAFDTMPFIIAPLFGIEMEEFKCLKVVILVLNLHFKSISIPHRD